MELDKDRFEIFIEKNKLIIKQNEIKIMYKCFENYDKHVIQISNYPLSFCHGDLKSVNIFYKNIDSNNYKPYFLDWQYIQLNKGDCYIVFY